MRHFYVHIPFCRQKCRYCSFYSIPISEYSTENYVRLLLQEIEISSDAFPFNELDNATLFFGGGTPSLFDAGCFAQIKTAIADKFKIQEFTEVTAECNPESISDDKLRKLRSLGVDRISIGIQSLNDEALRFLGRIHTAKQGLDAVGNAKNAGFKRIGADLIYGIPGFSTKRLLDNIKQVLESGVEHISLYSLTVENGTPLSNDVIDGKVKMPSADELAEQYYSASELLEPSGFYAYEVSNFSLRECECIHNLAYWNVEKYFGLGPSAHSFDGEKRWSNISSVSKYAEIIDRSGLPIVHSEKLALFQKFEECIMLGLRLHKGFSIDEALSNFALVSETKAILNQIIEPFINNGILIVKDGKVMPGKKHRLLADGIASHIIKGVSDAIERIYVP